jgi:hypothetical protein
MFADVRRQTGKNAPEKLGMAGLAEHYTNSTPFGVYQMKRSDD